MVRTHSHRMIRLLLPLAALSLVLLPLLAGCGSSAGSSGSALRIWYATDDPVERGWARQLVQIYERAHHGVQVQLNVLSFEDLNTKLQLALSAGDPPDLAYVTPRGPGIPAYVAAHKLRDLTAAAQQNDWSRLLRPGLLAQYNQPFGHYGAPAGHVVAVPSAVAAVGVLYNRRLLQRLHLAVPRSLAALESSLRRAKAAGYTPLGMGNGDGWLGDDWYLTLVNALVPPDRLAPEQRLDPTFSFRRPPFLAAGTLLRHWSTQGYFTPNFGGLDAQEGIDEFFRGHTLFQLISSSENAQITHDQRQTGLPIGIFAFPGPPNGTTPFSGYLGWVAPAAGHHPTEAISFISTMLSIPAAQFLLAHGVLPAARPSLLAGGTSVSPWVRSYLDVLNTARPGVYLDAAPIANLNATMEANVQLLLQGYEAPAFLVKSLEQVYTTHGHGGTTARIDGEF